MCNIIENALVSLNGVYNEAQWDPRLAALRSYLLEEASAPSAQEKEPHAGASSLQGEHPREIVTGEIGTL